jgi:hydrogenase nickel incorporation protein HypA/HybF
MHEMSIAMNVVEIAVTTARANGAGKINRVELALGALSGIIPEALHFCFASAAKETPAAEAELQLHIENGEAICESCGHQFACQQRVPACPQCGEMVFQVSGGTEMRVVAINVD